MRKSWMIMPLLIWFLCAPAWSDSTQVENGRKLFTAPLGSNGKSCSSCHADGKGLDHAGDYDSGMLREMINFCIRDALKGDLLAEDDPRLGQLEAYVQSLIPK